MTQTVVVKANDLIQKSRFNLSIQQQKIILFLISQINYKDEEFKEYEFSIQDFCKVCGIDYRSGSKYKQVKESIKNIADKSLWIEVAEDDIRLLRWISKANIHPKKGTIQIRLDEDMKPFLLHLKANFTEYKLLWTLKFKSKYAIRLYELVKSMHYEEDRIYERKFSLEELQKLMGAEVYTRFKDFRIYALEKAIEEINKYSDKTVEYIPLKNGRAVSAIGLRVKSKSFKESMELYSQIKDEFGLNQLRLY